MDLCAPSLRPVLRFSPPLQLWQLLLHPPPLRPVRSSRTSPPSLWTRTVSSGQSPNIRTVDKVEAGRVFFCVRVGSAAAAGRCCHEETSLIYTENRTQQPEDRLTEDEPTREQNRARSDGTCSAVHQPRKWEWNPARVTAAGHVVMSAWSDEICVRVRKEKHLKDAEELPDLISSIRWRAGPVRFELILNQNRRLMNPEFKLLCRDSESV